MGPFSKEVKLLLHMTSACLAAESTPKLRLRVQAQVFKTRAGIQPLSLGSHMTFLFLSQLSLLICKMEIIIVLSHRVVKRTKGENTCQVPNV